MKLRRHPRRRVNRLRRLYAHFLDEMLQLLMQRIAKR
jgi:hypothetical protein